MAQVIILKFNSTKLQNAQNCSKEEVWLSWPSSWTDSLSTSAAVLSHLKPLDIVAIEAKYHINCLVAFKNRHREGTCYDATLSRKHKSLLSWCHFNIERKGMHSLFENVCMSLVLTIEQDSRINFQVTVNKKWLVMIMNRLMQELPSICMMQWSKVTQQWCRRGGAGGRGNCPPPPPPPKKKSSYC